MEVVCLELRQAGDGKVDLYFETTEGWRRIENVLHGRISIHMINEAKLQRAERVERD